MKVIRDGDEETVTVKLGELPENEQQIAENGGGNEHGMLQGLALRDLDDQLRRHFDVAPRVESGAVIVGIEPDSTAARAGLRPGDVIIEANRKKVGSVEDLRDIVGKSDGPLLLRIHRQGGSVYLLLKK